MNERLTIQDLTDLLASKHSMTKKDAEAFVREFFLLIEETLENENYVKIKGLGTFKLIEVDSRESVNVNTGERFQIKGHTKISFNPDTNLKDTINKPFAHFETVVLNDNTVLEDTSDEDANGEEDESGEEKTNIQDEAVQEKYEEIVSISEEIVATESEEVVTTENVEEQQVVIPVIEQQLECESSPSNNKVELTAEQIIAQELQKINLEAEVPKNQQETSVPPIVVNSDTVAVISEKERIPPKEKSPIPYLITIIVLVLLLCSSAVVFIYYPDLFSSSPKKEILDMPMPAQPVQPSVQLADTIAEKDTITEPAPIINKETTAQSTLTAPAYSDSAVYAITGTKGMHTVSAGESLTRISLRYYGTKALWPYIVKHNQKVIKNPDNVPYGTTIKIPELTKK